jgi:predicted HicB family RNase H-like nuclease
MDSWIKTCLELGRTVPEPEGDNYSGQLRIRMPKSLHKALSQKAKDENISLNQLIVYHLAKSINQTF